ncbi:hypothetical protein [Stenoxybacter acetivorans]|uniref:hypothetical protein n=1 Tax=Stenoxybacter acetivorans TaxID=422441 RepID=UPI00055B3F35|nr:hypothetical protein [Stenoxybacter acetivorans]
MSDKNWFKFTINDIGTVEVNGSNDVVKTAIAAIGLVVIGATCLYYSVLNQSMIPAAAIAIKTFIK